MIKRFFQTGYAWFFAYTALFAVLAYFIFRGTWSPETVPVMPDCNTSFPGGWATYLLKRFAGWVADGKFVPDDLRLLLTPPAWQVEFQYCFAAWVAGLGMAYFGRGLGWSRQVSYSAGLLLAFSGYWFSLFSAGHLGWFRWMTYGVWGFGFADRAARGGRLLHWVLLGACVAWASFYQPDLWLLFTLLNGIWLIYRMVLFRCRNWLGVIAAAVVFFVVGMPSFYTAFTRDLAGRDAQIAEAGGKVADSKRDDAPSDKEERWIFVTNWSLPPNEIAEFFIPRLNGDTSCPMTLALGAQAKSGVKPYTGALGRPLGATSGNYRQHSLYVGFITMLLALVGVAIAIVRKNQLREVGFFAVAAVICCLLSCGRYCEPIYRLVYALPFGDYLRAPVKWHHLTEFCLVVLAAYGLHGIGKLAEDGKLKLSQRVVQCILGAIVVIGAIDLARVNRLYCAGIDRSQAEARNADMQLTFLRRDQFRYPQVVAMVKAGYIQSLARYPGRDDMYLVGVLEPRDKLAPVHVPNCSLATVLGGISLLATLSVLGFVGVEIVKSRKA